MPRKTQASSKRSDRHYCRSYSSSSYSSSSSDSDSDSATRPLRQDRPLRHAATMPAPAPMGPNAAMQPRLAPPPAVQVTLPPFSTLYLHIHSAQNLQIKSRYAYCKLFVGNTPMVDNTVFAALTHSQYQSFKTAVALVDQSQPVWNADFEIRINDPRVDMLSILVKRQQLLYCPIVGVCVVSLRSLIDSSGVDQWFPLRQGQFQTGHIRLQMLLRRIEQPTISPRARVSIPEAVVDYGAAASSIQAVPDRARSLDDDKRRRPKETRRHREARGHDRKLRERRKRRQEATTKEGSDSDEEKRSSVSENEAGTSDDDRTASVEGVRLEKEWREGIAERSASSQSRRSHTSGRSGSGGYHLRQADIEKPSFSSSAQASSNGIERRTLVADLYGESDRVNGLYAHREGRRETCKSDPIPTSMRVVGSDSIKSTCSSPIQQTHTAIGRENTPVDGTIELYAKCGAAPPPEGLMKDNTALELSDLTSPRCEAEQKGNNDDGGSETDSELSPSADSPIQSRSHRHRHKSKKKQRHKHRHHKHRQGDVVLPSQSEMYTLQPEVPTYPAAPICVLPPPPPSNGNVNGVAAKKLALIATRVASIAFLGADYTKAFTNTASNQIAANVATDVTLEGIPVVAESEACDFEIE